MSPARACLVLPGLCLLLSFGWAQAVPAISGGRPYKIINRSQIFGAGGIDYVHADNEGRRLYVPRGQLILVFNLDTLKPVGTITNTSARGVAVDPKSHHGFSSSRPMVMWDSRTLKTIKTIEVQGRPDSIVFEPLTERVYVFSPTQPNATILDSKDGAVVGTLDLGGAPGQATSDGQGRLYVVLEDKNNIAVIDVKALKVTTHYDLADKGGAPAGLALDQKNRILFAMCRNPATAVMLHADDGKILAALPIGQGTDGGGFNANTMEAFSSQGDGTLTIIKEKSPTDFVVAQTVPTKPGAKTCTLDTKNDRIIVITLETPLEPGTIVVPKSPATSPPRSGAPPVARSNVPSVLSILVLGRSPGP